MTKGKIYLLQLSAFLLTLMWVYAAISKLIDFPHFKWEMHNQAVYPAVKNLLVYCLPAIELVTALLLIFDRTVLWGFYCSALLMTVFTSYIILTLMHSFKYVPCSCGGILEHMSWTAHLFFNLFFLSLTLTSLYITKKERRPVTKMID
jgi:putative oxidoreductase